jgi:hypothetical protein
MLSAFVFLSAGTAEGVEINIINIPSPPVENNFLYVTTVTEGGSTQTVGPQVIGDLLSISENGTNLSFNIVTSSSLLQIIQFTNSPPAASFDETFTVAWTNFATNISLDLNPLVVLQPQNQTFSVGGNITLNTQVAHTSAMQWQKDGTNLVDDGHVFGAANATLMISNAHPSDEGNYALLLANPYVSITNGDASLTATLSVFKPLGLSVLPASFGFQLLVSNLDGSAIDGFESANIILDTTTNLVDSAADWNQVTLPSIDGTYDAFVTNSLFDIEFFDDGSPSRFWSVSQNR